MVLQAAGEKPTQTTQCVANTSAMVPASHSAVVWSYPINPKDSSLPVQALIIRASAKSTCQPLTTTQLSIPIRVKEHNKYSIDSFGFLIPAFDGVMSNDHEPIDRN